MIALVLLIAAAIVFVLGVFGAFTIGKMILVGLALVTAALIVERLEGARTRSGTVKVL